MPRSLLFALPLVCLLFAAKAKADPVTYNISFTASGQVAASGSYLLTFDPITTNYVATAGLSVVSFSDGFTAPTQLEYYYDASSDNLYIGGGVGGLTADFPGTNGYGLSISNFMTKPTFAEFNASSETTRNLYFDTTGTVSVSQIGATPEPSSIALLGTGLLGVAGVVRKRLASGSK